MTRLVSPPPDAGEPAPRGRCGCAARVGGDGGGDRWPSLLLPRALSFTASAVGPGATAGVGTGLSWRRLNDWVVAHQS